MAGRGELMRQLQILASSSSGSTKNTDASKGDSGLGNSSATVPSTSSRAKLLSMLHSFGTSSTSTTPSSIVNIIYPLKQFFLISD